MHLEALPFLKKLYVIITLFAVLISPSVEAQDQGVGRKPVYVIVHGAWGGSWAFRKVDSLMTEQGSIVYRPSLTGQGERVHLASADITLDTHIQDVVNMILFEELDEIILVGHSYGGMVISGVAEKVPERIRKLVYLDAMVPNDGESVMDIMDPEGNGLKNMIQGDYLVPVWVKADQKPPKDVPHPLKTFTEPIVLKSAMARQIPAAYILTVDTGKNADEDNFAKSAARAKERGWKVYQMSADHNPQWSAVEPLVKMLKEVQ